MGAVYRCAREEDAQKVDRSQAQLEIVKANLEAMSAELDATKCRLEGARAGIAEAKTESEEAQKAKAVLLCDTGSVCSNSPCSLC